MDPSPGSRRGRVSAEYPAPSLAELRTVRGGIYARGEATLPGQQKRARPCLGELPDRAIEVKMARLRRDNGNYEDTTTKKSLSPYPDDRTASDRLPRTGEQRLR